MASRLRDYNSPMTQYFINKPISFTDNIKSFFSKSYRKQLKLIVIGCGDIKWTLIGTDDTRSERRFSVIFYENELGHRKVEISSIGSDFDYLARLKEFHDLKLWLASGIRPYFYEDILQKKLMS
jgi:hypothetical protein